MDEAGENEDGFPAVDSQQGCFVEWNRFVLCGPLCSGAAATTFNLAISQLRGGQGRSRLNDGHQPYKANSFSKHNGVLYYGAKVQAGR
jgi:hypothetical protein